MAMLLPVNCVSALDGTPQFSFGAFTGPPTFCSNSNEGYTINVNNPPADIRYVWSVPSDATVVNGQNTPTINVAFGTSAGTVSVTVTTFCTSQTFNIAVSPGTCAMYAGDIDDGFSVGPSCFTTLDGGALTNVNSIVGPTGFCQNSTESFSIQVDNAPANTYYNWTVPADAVVSQGQGTNTVIVTFGVTDGPVSVDVITDCSVTNRSMPVTMQTCLFYAGGNNDGFSVGPSCATDLNGGAVFSITGITGSAEFCFGGNESFTAVTTTLRPILYYNWTVPSDATILSGQGTATILVQFGVSSGNISVDIITDCATVTPTAFPVTGSSCLFYAGGNNDGFSMIQTCATTLDGAGVLDPGTIIGSTTFCNFATEAYSINVLGANIETTFVWSVPTGASIISGTRHDVNSRIVWQSNRKRVGGSHESMPDDKSFITSNHHQLYFLYRWKTTMALALRRYARRIWMAVRYSIPALSLERMRHVTFQQKHIRLTLPALPRLQLTPGVFPPELRSSAGRAQLRCSYRSATPAATCLFRSRTNADSR